MLLILPLWTWLVTCGQVGVAVVGYPVLVDRGCVLRKNLGSLGELGEFGVTSGLAILNDLFSETLVTESHEKTYHVSICRSIPLNDTTSLAGAVKYNSKDEYVVLDEIDQAEVVVNKNTIVLTFIGNDVNEHFNKECHGNKWKTQLTIICDPYAIEDTIKLVGEDPDHLKVCQIKLKILTSKICRRDSSVFVKTPTIQDNKYNDLPTVINGSLINNTQYNNNVNDNNLNNYRHDGFVYIQNNSKQQNLHQDNSNNYIRGPYFKRRLMMNTENSTFVKQPSENVSQEIKEIYNEMTILLTKLFLIFIPRPIIVAVGIVLSVYYRWSSIIKCIKKIISSKMPKGEQPLLSENTPLIPVKDTSNEKVGVVKVDVEVKCLHHCGGKEEEKASQVATGFYYVKKIPKPIWIVIGAVAVVITMLILQMTLGGFIFCLLWIWCIWKSGQLSEENVPPVPVKDTLNEKVTQGQGENKKEFIGVVKVGVEVKGLHHQGDKDEGGASQGANGSSAVHVEQNTLSSAGIVEGTECTTDTSGESNISKETT